MYSPHLMVAHPSPAGECVRAAPKRRRPSAGPAAADLCTQACEHPHLLPLYAYCLDAVSPCLVFPLMVGGSLQTRLSLEARDVDHLKKTGP